MKISTGPENLSNLFNGNTYLTIPSFQRNYSWTSDQIQQFYLDVSNSAKDNDGHFYGPVVFLVDESKDKNHFEVIDGQQRMTTVVMLLSLLRDAAYSLDDKSLQGKGAPIDVRLRNILFLPDDYEIPRFTASYLVQDVFKSRIIDDPHDVNDSKKDLRKPLTRRGAQMTAQEVVNTKTLRAAYIKLQDSLQKDFDDRGTDVQKKEFLLSMFNALTTNFELHSMILDSEDDAYILFETLNDRGLRLSPSDLLKTLTLRDVRQSAPMQFDVALNKWDEMVENLGDYGFSKFLRHYLLTQTEGPVQAGKIFTLFKGIIQKHGMQGALVNLDKLFQASEYYSILLGLKLHRRAALNVTIARINTFSETHRVFLLAVLELEGDLSDDVLERLFRATEYLACRWIVASKNAQDLETKFYQKSLLELKAQPNDKTAIQIIDRFIKEGPQDSSLSELTDSDSIDLQKYFLRRIDESYGGHGVKWSDSITLEHLAPQKPGTNAPHWEANVCSMTIADSKGLRYSDYVGKWGNLTLLEQPLNSSIRNGDWQSKLNPTNSKYEGLNASTLNINKPLLGVSSWTAQTILTRDVWLQAESLNLISAHWVETGKVTVTQWKP